MGALEPPEASADSGEASLHCCLHSVHRRDALGSTMGECPITGVVEGEAGRALLKLFHMTQCSLVHIPVFLINAVHHSDVV